VFLSVILFLALRLAKAFGVKDQQNLWPLFGAVLIVSLAAIFLWKLTGFNS